MNQSGQHTSRSLRFKRWSRKSYAVFCSLGVTVTIGQLAVHVQEKSVVKLASAKLFTTINDLFDISEEITEEENDLLPASLVAVNQFVVAQNDIAASGSSVCVKISRKLNWYLAGSAFLCLIPKHPRVFE